MRTKLFQGSDLLLWWRQSESVPEREECQENGSEARENEEGVVDAIQGTRQLGAVSVGQEPTGVEDRLCQILQHDEAEADARVREDVGGTDENQVERCVLHARGSVLPFHLRGQKYFFLKKLVHRELKKLVSST